MLDYYVITLPLGRRMHTILKNQDAGGSLIVIFHAWDIHTMRRNQQDIGLTLDHFDIIFSHITYLIRKTLYILT